MKTFPAILTFIFVSLTAFCQPQNGPFPVPGSGSGTVSNAAYAATAGTATSASILTPGIWTIINGVTNTQASIDAAQAACSTSLGTIMVGPGTYTGTVEGTNAVKVKGSGRGITFINSTVTTLGGLFPLCDNASYEDFTATFDSTLVTNAGVTAAFFGNISSAAMQKATFNNVVIRNVDCPQPLTDFIYFNQASTSTNFLFDNITMTQTNGVWDWMAWTGGGGTFFGTVQNCTFNDIGPNIYGANAPLSHGINFTGLGELVLKNNVFRGNNTNEINIFCTTASGQMGLVLEGNYFSNSVPTGGGVSTNIFFDCRSTSYMIGRGNYAAPGTVYVKERSGWAGNLDVGDFAGYLWTNAVVMPYNISGNSAYSTNSGTANLLAFISNGVPTITGYGAPTAGLVLTNGTGAPLICNNNDFVVRYIYNSGVTATTNIFTVAYSKAFLTQPIPLFNNVTPQSMIPSGVDTGKLYERIDDSTVTSNGFTFVLGGVNTGLPSTTNDVHFLIIGQ